MSDPFVDTGVAVLEHSLDKPCQDFTREDLESEAARLERIYTAKAWTAYLSVHFPNSCWCNATTGEAKRREQRDRLLRSFDVPIIPNRYCSYCQRPAQHNADRSAIPLLTGATTMTIGPGGRPGFPVCSGCLFAVQFYPLATLKVNGRPLFWWTPQHDWMFTLTASFVTRVSQMLEGSPEQVPNLGWPSTRLLETAETALRQSQAAGHALPLVDLVGCHVTNYGSGPDYDEIRIGRDVLDFLKIAQQYPAYVAIRDSAWETPTQKSGRKSKPAPASPAKPAGAQRNFFFEDLGACLRSEAVPHAIIRRHFFPQAHPERNVFELACIFARKVVHMTQEQVSAIKQLADQIAASKKANDHLARLFQRRGIAHYVRTLTEISDRMKRAGEDPLAMETVLQAFNLAGEDDPFGRDGAIVRELILIRLIEALPKEQLDELPLLQSTENED